jgi:DNA polymerase
MPTPQERREALKRIYLEEARDCTRCPLHQGRTNVVFGAGDSDADLMFVGEAPGRTEDELGLPFVGRAGQLLDKLLGEIGLAREDVFITNVLKSRPPGNRDPQPLEIEACRSYLDRQVELIEPKVIATLGNFSTKLLRSDPTGITRLHGQAEERTIGARTVHLYPLYHPAAALYTPSMVEVLRADFARLPELLAAPAPDQPAALEVPEVEPEPVPVAAGTAVADELEQMGLF